MTTLDWTMLGFMAAGAAMALVGIGGTFTIALAALIQGFVSWHQGYEEVWEIEAVAGSALPDTIIVSEADLREPLPHLCVLLNPRNEEAAYV